MAREHPTKSGHDLCRNVLLKVPETIHPRLTTHDPRLRGFLISCHATCQPFSQYFSEAFRDRHAPLQGRGYEPKTIFTSYSSLPLRQFLRINWILLGPDHWPLLVSFVLQFLIARNLVLLPYNMYRSLAVYNVSYYYPPSLSGISSLDLDLTSRPCLDVLYTPFLLLKEIQQTNSKIPNDYYTDPLLLRFRSNDL